MFNSVWEIFSPYFFKNLFCPILSFLSLWDSQLHIYTHITFHMMPRNPEILFCFVFSIFLCLLHMGKFLLIYIFKFADYFFCHFHSTVSLCSGFLVSDIFFSSRISFSFLLYFLFFCWKFPFIIRIFFFYLTEINY